MTYPQYLIDLSDAALLEPPSRSLNNEQNSNGVIERDSSNSPIIGSLGRSVSVDQVVAMFADSIPGASLN
jgi:hypothetical protein